MGASLCVQLSAHAPVSRKFDMSLLWTRTLARSNADQQYVLARSGLYGKPNRVSMSLKLATIWGMSS